MAKNDVVVLGGGLTGLSFAYHYDADVPLYEREERPGGLARTNVVDGCHFDLAPHLLHLRTDYVRDLLFDTLGFTAETHARRARIYYDGCVIPYPFELNLHGLSEKVREDCLRGLDDVDATSREDVERLKSGSYEEYVLRAFGPGIGNHYLLPYNRKIWATEPSEMTCEWMRFLPTADVEKIREYAEKPADASFGYNVNFYYPTEGGIEALPRALAQPLGNLQCGREAVRIDTEAKTVVFADGEVVGYERLVSTLPLPALAALSDLDGVKEPAKRLVHTTVYVVNLVVRGSVPDGAHWMYFPDPDLCFYRMSFPKNFFANATPGDEQILAVEVGSRDHDMPVGELQAKVEEQVLGLGLFDVTDHLFTHCDVLPVAYSIYDFERTPAVKDIAEAFRERDVFSVGRYGFWEYSAMEHAILYGKELAEELRQST